jgi:transcriptional regulator with XRE-family HTH domain
MSTISERMKEKKFASDAALAVAVNCDRTMVSRIRRGKAQPSLELAVRLSKALDLPESTFILPEREGQAA